MSGDLTVNKILGACLATGIVIMLVGTAAGAIYHREAPEKPGYLIAVAEAEGAGGAEAEVLPDWGTVLATADVAAGEKVFAKCTSCHNIASGGPNMTGPGLYGVVGRAVASHGGFAYSDAMVAHKAEAPNWTDDELNHFLTAPAKWVKGTKMNFPGIKKVEDRVNLIAYMRAQGSSGYPVPAPDPSRQPGAAPVAEGAAPTEGTPTTGGTETNPVVETATPAPAPAH